MEAYNDGRWLSWTKYTSLQNKNTQTRIKNLLETNNTCYCKLVLYILSDRSVLQVWQSNYRIIFPV